ncbi:hypothetical protein BU14_1975s0001 [Porphyra umbilicalis]|uniref:Uncharacterized protein n=1 Tax=Porphyra umbilicalis TaxID=2786 RepID=A0A1X6NKJ9_PORUM|nr:hypothetical protein BU14_1975s0001 [Porphyra umbilicalis]|eukprot:OSX69006.1 hypothetical protein BU14_1975s0001 [Porphyra umbilicalis]
MGRCWWAGGRPSTRPRQRPPRRRRRPPRAAAGAWPRPPPAACAGRSTSRRSRTSGCSRACCATACRRPSPTSAASGARRRDGKSCSPPWGPQSWGRRRRQRRRRPRLRCPRKARRKVCLARRVGNSTHGGPHSRGGLGCQRRLVILLMGPCATRLGRGWIQPRQWWWDGGAGDGMVLAPVSVRVEAAWWRTGAGCGWPAAVGDPARGRWRTWGVAAVAPFGPSWAAPARALERAAVAPRRPTRGTAVAGRSPDVVCAACPAWWRASGCRPYPPRRRWCRAFVPLCWRVPSAAADGCRPAPFVACRAARRVACRGVLSIK